MTRILLVEDNEMNRDMLARRLQRYGFSVSFAPDGPTGIRMANEELPDLILMDIALGEMDGWEATRCIKANARTAAIPVIAITAHAHERDRLISLSAGCSEYDTKPVDLTRLLSKIRYCLEAAGKAGGKRAAIIE
jgi:CheY-like chemotaxis protein